MGRPTGNKVAQQMVRKTTAVSDFFMWKETGDGGLGWVFPFVHYRWGAANPNPTATVNFFLIAWDLSCLVQARKVSEWGRRTDSAFQKRSSPVFIGTPLSTPVS